MKRLGSVMLILAISVWGCVTVDSSTIVDADSQGYANGQYRDVRHGKVCDFGIFATGGAGGASSTAATALTSLVSATALSSGSSSSNNSSSGAGAGLIGLRVYPPPQGDPVPFAKAIAMINYSKKLKNISYDESGGRLNYEFGEPNQRTRPSSFGHQPVQ